MRKSAHVELEADLSDALVATANFLVKRSSEIAVVPAKIRALELARKVLRDAPDFGSREVGDPEILAALKSLNLGGATFRKALSEARKELARKPGALAKPLRKCPPDKKSAVLPMPSRATKRVMADPLIVPHVDRKLL